jgi:hypothetical protein
LDRWKLATVPWHEKYPGRFLAGWLCHGRRLPTASSSWDGVELVQLFTMPTSGRHLIHLHHAHLMIRCFELLPFQ